MCVNKLWEKKKKKELFWGGTLFWWMGVGGREPQFPPPPPLLIMNKLYSPFIAFYLRHSQSFESVMLILLQYFLINRYFHYCARHWECLSWNIEDVQVRPPERDASGWGVSSPLRLQWWGGALHRHALHGQGKSFGLPQETFWHTYPWEWWGSPRKFSCMCFFVIMEAADGTATLPSLIPKIP